VSDPELIIVGGGIGGAAVALRAAQYHLPCVWVTGDRSSHRASRASHVHNVDNMIGVHPRIVQERLAGMFRESDPSLAARIDEPHLHISTLDIVSNARQRIESDYGELVRIVDDRAIHAGFGGPGVRGAFRLPAGGRADSAPEPHPAPGAGRADAGFVVRTADGEEHFAPNLVLATGVMDRQPRIYKERGGRNVSGIQWVFPYANHETLLYCIRCEGHLTAGRRIAVIGGGDGAAEVALMIRERYGSAVTILTGGEPVRWNERLALLLRIEGVEVHPGRIVDIEGSDGGASLSAFLLEDGRRVEADLGFVAMGLHRVYNELAVELGAELEESSELPERRHVLVDRNGETTIPGLFAVGDMARRHDEALMKQICTAQEFAVRAVDTIDRRRRRARRAALLGAE